MKTPPAITDTNTLPIFVKIREMSAVYRRSPSTIRRMLKLGTWRPLPCDWTPLLWSREDILADLARRRGSYPPNGNGFAARARSQAKASLTPARGRGKKKAS